MEFVSHGRHYTQVQQDLILEALMTGNAHGKRSYAEFMNSTRPDTFENGILKRYMLVRFMPNNNEYFDVRVTETIDVAENEIVKLEAERPGQRFVRNTDHETSWYMPWLVVDEAGNAA